MLGEKTKACDCDIPVSPPSMEVSGAKVIIYDAYGRPLIRKIGFNAAKDS